MATHGVHRQEVMSENLKAEKQRNDEILFSLLPPSVVKDLNKNMLVQVGP